jgi:signal-transduction protein with cAMP-binding, CBS, and nucleotidyltransferase domain
MQVHELMTDKPRFVSGKTSLKEAARQMRDMDFGFLPIADEREQKLQGVVTDRDITIRAVAEGRDPESTTVADIETHKVLYCFKGDDVANAAKRMRDQQVYRLVVLDNRDNKKLCGVISLGDILRHKQGQLAEKTAEAIVA